MTCPFNMLGKKLKPLYGLTSQGKTKMWVVESFDNRYEVTHGLVGGKLQTKARPIVGKNIGRANETTPKQQAEKEAEAKWNKQYDKGYRIRVEELGDIPIRAMKLQTYYNDNGKKVTDNRHHINWPALVQPKLNGIKSLVTSINGCQS